jgi:hypothetical protein
MMGRVLLTVATALLLAGPGCIQRSRDCSDEAIGVRRIDVGNDAQQTMWVHLRAVNGSYTLFDRNVTLAPAGRETITLDNPRQGAYGLEIATPAKKRPFTFGVNCNLGDAGILVTDDDIQFSQLVM